MFSCFGSAFSWFRLQTSPRVIRPYVKEILLHMVAIHADVTTCSKPFLFRVVSTLHSRIAQLFAQTIKSGEKKITATGAQQVREPPDAPLPSTPPKRGGASSFPRAAQHRAACENIPAATAEKAN